MRDELNRKEFHEAIDTTLSGLQGDPWLARRVFAQAKGEQNGSDKQSKS